ncbi:queuosine biosynthesis protein queC [Microbacterium sp. MYb66]|uniref:queuosine biosynthesis protein queC n=1 Tax=Microbacterium sp. MYb66 TaxID=1848692 RepID=UPI0011B079E7|nr:queuosine biosynthesis protein queC [Microbacterium sp. MYb66]
MTVHQIEVLPAGARSSRSGVRMEWPRTGSPVATIASTLMWDLEEFAAAPPAARDLFRITAAAYLADTATPKPAVSLHRNLDLVVHVEDPEPWTHGGLTAVADILHWLTGDSWTLGLKAAHAILPLAVAEPAARIQLLSGGLDSLCGAVIGLRDTDVDVRFVGHRDASRAVRHAQNTIAEAIGDSPYDRHELFLRDAGQRKNHGPRSRSLMFMTLGVMTAAAHSAGEMWVPENGFTSINPPLDPGRGGTLTTRSTHPYTFHLVGELLRSLGIDVVMRNPFDDLTKGELVAAAIPELLGTRFLSATSTSFSCAKGGTQFYHGDSNHNCGLCVACVVRRGAFFGAGVPDPTTYDCEALSGHNLTALVHHRRRDVITLRDACAFGISDEAILSSAMWPPGTNFDEVLSLVQRGLAELSRVPLPAP